jgi:hypothetical protein
MLSIIFFYFFNSTNAFSQSIKNLTDVEIAYNAIFQDITVDNSNNVISIGYKPYYENNEEYMTLTKFDSDNHILWEKRFKDVQGYDITTDKSGNIYIIGQAKQTTTINDVKLQVDANYYIKSEFILKLNKMGDFQWIKPFKRGLDANSYYRAYSPSIETDSNGDIHVFGTFFYFIEIDNFRNEIETIPNSYQQYVNYKSDYLLKMRDNGSLIYAKALNKTFFNSYINTQQPPKIVIDKLDNVYIY